MDPRTPPPDAATQSDLITPHADAEPAPGGEPAPELTPGIVDPRTFRLGPEAVDPPAPGLPPPDPSP